MQHMRSHFAMVWDDLTQNLRGWGYKQALSTLKETQWMDPEKAQKVHSKRLSTLLRHCYEHVPFYHQALASINFDPNILNPSHVVHQLPIITKNDLRQNYQRFKATNQNDAYDVWTSSGSTGEPFPFRIDRRSIQSNTFASIARGREWWGIQPGMPEAMIWSGLSDMTGTVKGRLAAVRRRISWTMKNISLVDVYLMDASSIERAYRKLLRKRPIVTRSIASGLLNFCNGIDRLKLNGRLLGIKIAIYTGEGLTRNQRKFIEATLGCRTVSEYGCTELGIIAFECPEGGLHINHENLFTEILVNNRPAREGECGELIITNLNSWAYPLIRYRVGDLAIATNRRCTCGRTLPLLGGIVGRTHDCIRTPAGRVINGLFFTHLFDDLPQVKQFRVTQKLLNELLIEIVVEGQDKAIICKSIQDEALKKVKEPINVNVRLVDSIPSGPGGKSRWIVSEID